MTWVRFAHGNRRMHRVAHTSIRLLRLAITRSRSLPKRGSFAQPARFNLCRRIPGGGGSTCRFCMDQPMHTHSPYSKSEALRLDLRTLPKRISVNLCVLASSMLFLLAPAVSKDDWCGLQLSTFIVCRWLGCRLRHPAPVVLRVLHLHPTPKVLRVLRHPAPVVLRVLHLHSNTPRLHIYDRSNRTHRHLMSRTRTPLAVLMTTL